MKSIPNVAKINRLIKNWHGGTIKTVKELERFGYSPQLLKSYSNSGWIELYTRGAYKLAQDEVRWEGILYGIQHKSENLIHAGGRTALELKGYGHFARESKKFIFGGRLEHYNTLLKKMKNSVFKRTESFPYYEKVLFTKYDAGGYEIIISTPELAAMEMIYLIPSEQTFNESLLIMESLTTLRPKIVQLLLEKCKSYKVKRIFMWMAEKNNLEWVNDLDLNKVEFGEGKLSLIKNGKLDKKYQITVPAENV